MRDSLTLYRLLLPLGLLALSALPAVCQVAPPPPLALPTPLTLP